MCCFLWVVFCSLRPALVILLWPASRGLLLFVWFLLVVFSFGCFFSALRLVFGVGSAWLSPCFVPPCSARPLGLSSGAFWSSQCSAGPSLWVSGCVCDFFVDGANRLSPGHRTWRLTCGPAGNRTATGSLSATSRTSAYQLLHRDAYLVVFATARLSCLAWYRGRNIKNHEKGVRCMSSLRDRHTRCFCTMVKQEG